MPRAPRQPEITHAFALELIQLGLASSHAGAVRMAQRARIEGSKHHDRFAAWLSRTASGALGAKPSAVELTAFRAIGRDTPPPDDSTPEPPSAGLMDLVEDPPAGVSNLRWMATRQMRTWRFADHQLAAALRANDQMLAAHYTRLMPQLHASVQAAEKAALDHEATTRHLIPAKDLEEATRTVIVPLSMTVSNLRTEFVTVLSAHLAPIIEQRIAEWDSADIKPAIADFLKTILADVIAVGLTSVKQWHQETYRPALHNALTFLQSMGPEQEHRAAA